MNKIVLIKVSKYLSSIDGVAIYPIVTLLIFSSFFLLVFLLTFKIDKKTIRKNSRLPLNNYEKDETTN